MDNGQHAAIRLIFGAWFAWAVLWAVMSYGTKAVVRRENLGSRAMHLVPLGVAALLLVTPDYSGRVLNIVVLPRGGWMVYAGVAGVALGLGFAIWARVVLAGNWSGTVTLKAAHELVRRGPYRLVRHPIYTGLLTALLGTAVAIDAWRAVLALMIVAASFIRKMRTEEAFMRAEFGAAYDDYCRTTPALLPGIF